MISFFSGQMPNHIWVQILDEAVCVLLCSNAFGNDMNPSVLPPAIG